VRRRASGGCVAHNHLDRLLLLLMLLLLLTSRHMCFLLGRQLWREVTARNHGTAGVAGWSRARATGLQGLKERDKTLKQDLLADYFRIHTGVCWVCK
jgi:hypothetical protein